MQEARQARFSRRDAAVGCRRTARRFGDLPGAAACLGLCLGLLACLTSCQVPQAEPPQIDLDFATVPNLRRARVALEDSIALEREHVLALEGQLAGLRKDEERAYAEFLQTEQDYQLLQSDLGGTQQDLAETEQELAALRVRVDSTRQRIQLLHDELRRMLDELARLHGLQQQILALSERLGPAPDGGATAAAEQAASEADASADGESEGAAEAESDTDAEGGTEDGGETPADEGGEGGADDGESGAGDAG